MRLVYYHGKQPNFGDDLNDVLWPRLLPGVFNNAGLEGFLGIGTLIGMATPGVTRLNVFSTGAGYDSVANWKTDRVIWCVRGPITAKLLGGEHSAALTDGAILMPEVFGLPAGDLTGRTVGVVPHCQSLHYPGWDAACEAAGFQLISPIDTPERVHAAIGKVSLILTESLHGAIFSDTMGIPWIPFVTTRNVSALKWVDWCLSVGVAFAPVSLPPPSASAALAFGRPDPGAADGLLHFDAEAAIAEFKQRVALHGTAAKTHSPSVGRRVHAGVRETARRSALVSRLLGYGPAQTAAHLVKAAQRLPTLSSPSNRADLHSAMLERLRAFERVQRAGFPRPISATAGP